MFARGPVLKGAARSGDGAVTDGVDSACWGTVGGGVDGAAHEAMTPVNTTQAVTMVKVA